VSHIAPKRTRRFDIRPAVGVAGEVMITLGVVILLFVGYELWFTGVYTAQAQSNLKKQLSSQWAQLPPAPVGSASASPDASPDAPASASPSPAAPDVVPGDALALMKIPRLGSGYSFAVVEGVSTADLKKGPGHYPGTALPGQIGNFVVSGHRTTYLAPFNGLDKLQPGDAIVIETADTWYTYRVTSLKTVLPTDIAVILPVPGKKGAKPKQALITLTTCTPKYSASHRLIVQGFLQSTLPKSAGLPPALKGT
jgi:sortase A